MAKDTRRDPTELPKAPAVSQPGISTVAISRSPFSISNPHLRRFTSPGKWSCGSDRGRLLRHLGTVPRTSCHQTSGANTKLGKRESNCSSSNNNRWRASHLLVRLIEDVHRSQNYTCCLRCSKELKTSSGVKGETTV